MKNITQIESDVKCPLCNATMVGQTDTQSFVWACKDCPGVLFEFYNEKDIKFLENILQQNCDN